MRRSQVARETERVVNALSPIKNAPTRRSLRQYAHGSVQPSQDEDSDFSTALSSPHDNENATASSIKKRKRGQDVKIANVSPRKAPKLESDSEKKPKARRQPAKHIKGPNGIVLKTEPPTDWEKIYEITQVMRKRVIAPVDTMGCESLAEDHRSPRDRRLQTLIALMLSSQTKDTVTFAAMKNMQDNMVGGLTLESLLLVEPDVLNKLIGQVGFHNNKTKYIKATAIKIRDDFASEIPDTIDGLISLPGVGPKMAYLTMSAAWGQDLGIGVDVHVHRITNLWRWHKTSTPEQTRAELESWLPRDKWHDINHLLVGFGQTICSPVGRRCDDCDLATAKLCPSVVAGSVARKKVKKELVVKVEGEEVREVIMKADDVGIKIETADEEQGLEVQAVTGAALEMKEGSTGTT